MAEKTTNYWWLEIVLIIKFNFLCIKMEFQKIVNLFDTTSDDKDLPRFINKKWIEVYDQTGGNNYNTNKEIRIKRLMLRSDLCDFINAYIAVEGEITVAKMILWIMLKIKEQQPLLLLILQLMQ